MVKTSILRLLRDGAGATAVEYGLIVALVGVLAVAALDRVGSSIGQTVMTASDSINAR
jgi:pilus assembly protein Flp/PilA